MQSIENILLKRIRGRGRGAVVTPKDFLDIGNRPGVDKALSRLVQNGVLNRVDRGVYSFPEKSRLIGELSPTPEAVAKALARSGSQKLIPSGAYAANLLGLTEQVPAKVEYLTDGPSRRAMIQRLPVVLRQTTTRNLATAGRVTGVVVQALRFLRRVQVDEAIVEKLRKRLSRAEKAQLLKDIPLVPTWMADVFRQVANKEDIR